MKNILKIITNGRVISAVVSAIGAIVSAICAGCKLYCGEMSIKQFECAIGNVSTNLIERVN